MQKKSHYTCFFVFDFNRKKSLLIVLKNKTEMNIIVITQIDQYRKK